jgi:hypothetical protein
MSEISPPQEQALRVFVKEYNSATKALTLTLLLADFDLLEIDEPYGYVIEVLNELYQQVTVDLLEQYLGIAEIEAGNHFPHWETRIDVIIREDYLLEEIRPDGWIPASVVDPGQWEFLKWKRIELIYCYEPDFPEVSEFDNCPSDQPSQNIIYPAYPSGLTCSWPLPNLATGLSWRSIWSGYAGFSPEFHWKYRILAPFHNCIAANPSSSDAWMKEEIWDCFRESTPDDGSPWYSDGNPVQYISKGINDDWLETYDELKDRDYAPNAYRRIQRWLANSGEYSYRLVQPGNEDHVQIEARIYDDYVKIYKKKPSGNTGGTPRPPFPDDFMRGILGTILSSGKAIIKHLFSLFIVNSENFIVNSENFEVKDS